MKSVKLAIIVLVISLIGCKPDANENGNKELFIDHYKSECFSFGLWLCMRSRLSSDDDWSLFYGDIEGFNYEWGYVYKLRVNVSNIDNSPEDSYSLKYTLVEIISKEKETSDTTFDIAASRAPGLVVKKATGVYELYGEKEFSCAPVECASIDSLINQDLAIMFEFSHNTIPSDPLQMIQVKCSASRESFRGACL